MNYILGIIYLIVTGAVIFSMSVLVLQGEKTKSNHMYIACHGCVTIWCSSQILILLSGNVATLAATYIYGNLGICFSGAFWILFSIFYGDNNVKLKPVHLIPVVMSAIHYLIVVTNHWHHLFYSEFTAKQVMHGPAFYSNVIETYIFITIGAIILFRKRSSLQLKKRAIILIVLAVFIPLSFSIINLLGFVNATFDITPLGFAISVILVRIATNRYKFFDMKKELTITNEKLLLEKERNRIAQQVHDTTGHTLTMLQSYMKLTEVAVKDNSNDDALSYISEARQLTSKGIRELRESINKLRHESESMLVTQGVLQLAHQVKEIPCEVTLQGEDKEEYSYLSWTIYDTVRECITNSLKYADAERIDIVVKFKEKNIELIVADDGIGCKNIVDNNGLRGIKERINAAGGSVKFISGEGEGFMTRVSLPL